MKKKIDDEKSVNAFQSAKGNHYFNICWADGQEHHTLRPYVKTIYIELDPRLLASESRGLTINEFARHGVE